MDYVLFDVGNVIVNANHELTHDFLQERGVPGSDAIRFYDNGSAYGNFERGRISAAEFCGELNATMNTRLSEDKLRQAHHVHIYEVAPGIIDQIGRVPYAKRGVLTDTNEWQNQRVAQLINLEEYFPQERIFKSNQMGHMKIDAECFPYVLERLGVSGERVLLIDDSNPKIELARENGLQTILFENVDQLAEELGQYGF